MDSPHSPTRKTSPALPPGLSLNARVALSSPHILPLVLSHLRHLSTAKDETSRPPYYDDLLAASLVNKSWTRTAQLVLMEEVWIGGGTKKLKEWLDAADVLDKKEGEGGRKNAKVIFVEAKPMRFSSADAEKSDENEGAKWSLEVLQEVLQLLRGVESMFLVFPFLKDKGLPVELLSGEGLKGSSSTVIPLLPPLY
jgi:hypothetical protein